MNTHAAAPDEEPNPHLLDDAEFEALEELLTSDAVPEDCMDLEMLDGYLAGVLLSPVPIVPERWLPEVWSAHGEEASFGSGSRMQEAIRLVRRYYNELATTLGEPGGWEPFCYAAAEGDALDVGEEWIEGFAQGLELWPGDWDAGVPTDAVQAVRHVIEMIMAPWADDATGQTDDDDDPSQPMELAAAGIGEILALWRNLGHAPVGLLTVEPPMAPTPARAGRNDACPCGSGKKYKKCCGAPQ